MCKMSLPPGHKTLVLSPDYAATMPLWRFDWTSLDLSPELLDRLGQWQAEFDQNFDAYSGWASVEARSRWAEEAEGLALELRSALPKDVELTVDLWPLEGDTE